MKTIKIIDLFQKMVEGKQLPQRIKIRNHTFELDEEIENIEEMYKDGYLYWLRNQDRYNITFEDEVEIIEAEKEIEKPIGYENFESIDDYIEHLRSKIDELIDAVNEKRRGN